jgi:hypothetical protein
MEVHFPPELEAKLTTSAAQQGGTRTNWSGSAALPRRTALELSEVVALIAFVVMPLFAYLPSMLAGAPLWFGGYSISTVAGSVAC